MESSTHKLRLAIIYSHTKAQSHQVLKIEHAVCVAATLEFALVVARL